MSEGKDENQQKKQCYSKCALGSKSAVEGLQYKYGIFHSSFLSYFVKE